MADQATEAVDPFEQAVALIANGDTPSDELEEELQDEATEEDEEDSTDEEGEQDKPASAEPSSSAIEFAGKKFDIPEGTPPELAAQVQEVGKSLYADYTRKSQELSSREKQAAEIVQKEIETGREQVTRALQFVDSFVKSVGGLMDAGELAQLAATDPQAWIQANARQQALAQIIGNIQSQAQVIDSQAIKAKQMRDEASKQEAWTRLNEQGVSREALQSIWTDALTSYDFLSNEKLSNVLDADSWLILRDAVAFRKLQGQKSEIKKKVSEAPKLPESKKPMTQTDRARLDARKAVMRKGGASLRDLSAFIETNMRK